LIQDARVNVDLKHALDWGKLVPLELRARTVADGIYAGAHRSPRRGAGVEFGGHRAYVPGDDLRWLDRHALMRHGRLLVREFETETDRALCLVLDGSASMAYKSPGAPGAKLAYAAVLAAALARIAVTGGDPVALDWLGGDAVRGLAATGSRQAFERVVAALESARPGGDLVDLTAVDRSLAPLVRHAGRGSVIVLFSDLIDLPAGTLDRFASLANRDRVVIGVRVLDPVEAEFPFEGALRLRSSEGAARVETDGSSARAGYLAALEAIAESWRRRLIQRGGRLVCATTSDDPVEVVRAILLAVAGNAP
jgi:uncharacterized protein (DUF58 family)